MTHPALHKFSSNQMLSRIMEPLTINLPSNRESTKVNILPATVTDSTENMSKQQTKLLLLSAQHPLCGSRCL